MLAVVAATVVALMTSNKVAAEVRSKRMPAESTNFWPAEWGNPGPGWFFDQRTKAWLRLVHGHKPPVNLATNCRNCGAPIKRWGGCDYCGTEVADAGYCPDSHAKKLFIDAFIGGPCEPLAAS